MQKPYKTIITIKTKREKMKNKPLQKHVKNFKKN